VFVMKRSMVVVMQRLTGKWAICTLSALTLGSGLVRGNVDTNPYATIVDRNPFGLKPPPPPPPPPEQTAPPVPMAKVTLTGLLSTFGEPRVLLEIIEDPTKGGGTAKKPILREGERLGPVEVLAIDVVKNTVRLRNSGVETNVTFEVAKSGPVPGGPGIPGAPPTFTPPPPLGIPQPQNPQASAPTVISPNGANPGNSGVTLMGNNPTTPSGSVPTALGAATDGGMRTIPSRPLRTENSAMTKEQADLLMEVNRMRAGAAGQDPSQQNPAFPRLPYNPRGAPPVPGR
jgi:hypothetical protein